MQHGELLAEGIDLCVLGSRGLRSLRQQRLLEQRDGLRELLPRIARGLGNLVRQQPFELIDTVCAGMQRVKHLRLAGGQGLLQLAPSGTQQQPQQHGRIEPHEQHEPPGLE